MDKFTLKHTKNKFEKGFENNEKNNKYFIGIFFNGIFICSKRKCK